MDSVSVIIPVRGASPALRHCLDRVETLDPQASEIIVVNDGADALVREWCRKRGLKQIETETARGPAAARNLGAVHSTGSILMFVDSDVLPQPDLLERVASAFDENPHVAALFGSYDDSPPEPDFFSQYKNLFHHFTHQNGNRRAETFWAGLGAIRRDAFFVVGGFDARYQVPCVEDIELGYRMRERGLEIELKPDLQAAHMKRWTLASLLYADFFQRAIPWTELLWRFPERKADLNLRPRELVGAAFALLVVPLLVASSAWGALHWMAPLTMAVWLTIHLPFYSFLLERRGPWFAAASAPLHWFYFLYSSLAFAVGTARHLLGLVRLKQPALREVPV